MARAHANVQIGIWDDPDRFSDAVGLDPEDDFDPDDDTPGSAPAPAPEVQPEAARSGTED